MEELQGKYPSDSLYFSQPNLTINDYFDKSKKIISSHNLNENDIRKRAKNLAFGFYRPLNILLKF